MRTIKFTIKNKEIHLQVTEDAYHKYMRPYWASIKRQQRAKEYFEKHGYSLSYFEELLEEPITTDTPETIYLQKEEYQQLWNAVYSLPKNEQELIYHICLENETISAYADRVGLHRNTVSTQLKKVLKKLKKLLTK